MKIKKRKTGNRGREPALMKGGRRTERRWGGGDVAVAQKVAAAGGCLSVLEDADRGWLHEQGCRTQERRNGEMGKKEKKEEREGRRWWSPVVVSDGGGGEEEAKSTKGYLAWRIPSLNLGKFAFLNLEAGVDARTCVFSDKNRRHICRF